MNEKIQRLADQCWLEKFHLNEDGAKDYCEFDYEKFAKLIIKECCQVLDHAEEYDLDEERRLKYKASFYIEKHFYVVCS